MSTLKTPEISINKPSSNNESVAMAAPSSTINVQLATTSALAQPNEPAPTNEKKRPGSLQLDQSQQPQKRQKQNQSMNTPQLQHSISMLPTPSTTWELNTPMLENLIKDIVGNNPAFLTVSNSPLDENARKNSQQFNTLFFNTPTQLYSPGMNSFMMATNANGNNAVSQAFGQLSNEVQAQMSQQPQGQPTFVVMNNTNTTSNTIAFIQAQQSYPNTIIQLKPQQQQQHEQQQHQQQQQQHQQQQLQQHQQQQLQQNGTNNEIKVNTEPCQTVPVHVQNGLLMNGESRTGGQVAKARKNRKVSTKTQSSSSNPSSPALTTASNSSFNNGGSHQFSPIDLGMQDDMKLEKKRERNREAAQKCRQRKLEKIAELQKEVSGLSQANDNIAQESDKLRREIENLQKIVDEHKKNFGCELKATENSENVYH